ncbi:hypothetical protein [Pseudoalteromonas sp. T1lg22]|uniref:hypothetical protein n=1 Tax=Pseudoalteromonas sp. T1lg22 TaxID=2077096 RepID=UPI000CF5EAC8|nr:hypothetical protein [Pseudoalteromonas sp. T1lg22]
MGFSAELIDKYKAHKEYTQDKQVVSDLDKCHKSCISEIRSGKRHLTATQCIFLAKQVGIDPKEALLELAIEKAKTKEEESILKDTLKKISAACILTIAIAAAHLSGPTMAPLMRNWQFNII